MIIPHSFQSSYARPTLQGRRRGFTLIELMITLTIAAILLSIAAPSFRSFVLNQRVKNASSSIFYALTLARSEAIKRNALVTVTKESAGWQDGWTVTSGTTTLSQQGAFTNLTITNAQNSVTYGADGRLTATAAPTFAVTGGTGTAARCVTISLSGLPRTKTGSC